VKESLRSQVPPFYVMEVMKAAALREAGGGDVLHLEVGQPMTPAPSRVLEAARKGLIEDRLGYTAATGLGTLRERIGRFYQDRYGLDVSPDRVVLTIGASAGFVLACLALFDPGDRVAMTVPGYSAYRNVLSALGLELVEVRVDAETRFVPSTERLEVAGPLDGLVVASPSNPTGVTLTPEELSSVVDFCETSGTVLISDEIYHGIHYGGRAASALEFSDAPVVVQSFSKYFSMTGWRLGYAVWPESLVEGATRLAVNCHSCVNASAQFAGIAALEGPQNSVGEMVAAFDERRQVIVEGLSTLPGVTCRRPGGAFYAFPNVGGTGESSDALQRRMLEEAGIAVISGTSFGAFGEGYVRFSYANSTENIERALERMGEMM